MMTRDYRSIMVLFNALLVNEQCHVADEVLHQADKILVDGDPILDYRVRVTPSGRYLIHLSKKEPFTDEDG